jgi:HAD superfamily hydrolase (TIGR01509 family)
MTLADRSLWVFDLDGTLTRPNLDFDAIRAALGIPPGHLILEYLDTLPPEQATPLRRRLAEIEAERARACEPAPGCGELLEALAHRGAELGILTRNTRQNARYALAAIGALPYFTAECILGRDEAAPKPDPDGILKLARHHDRPADRGVMVGDFRLDLEAGRAAGCLTVHVAGDGPRWPELTDIGVQNLHELTALLP